MAYYEFPHTENYDTDLAFLIEKYNTLVKELEEVNEKIDNIQITGGSVEVVDNLTSTDKTKALSANQGKVLNDLKANKTELTSAISKLEIEIAKKANSSDIPDISNLATKTELNAKVDKTTYDTNKTATDKTISDNSANIAINATSIENLKNSIETMDDSFKQELDNKADKTSLSNYATKDDLTSVENSIPDISNLATKDELNEKQDILTSGVTIKTINGTSLLGSGNLTITGGGEGSNVNVVNDLTSNSATDALSANMGKTLNEAKADKTDIPDISGLATKTELNNYATETELTNVKNSIPDLTDYAKSADVTSEIKTATDEVKALIPSTDNFATKTELNNKVDLTTYTADKTQLQYDINQKANASDLSNYETVTNANNTKEALETLIDTKANISDIPDISGLATKTEVETKQDKLTAGNNITIVDNVISATGGNGTGGSAEFTDTKVDLLSLITDKSAVSVNDSELICTIRKLNNKVCFLNIRGNLYPNKEVSTFNIFCDGLNMDIGIADLINTSDNYIDNYINVYQLGSIVGSLNYGLNNGKLNFTIIGLNDGISVRNIGIDLTIFII